MTPPVHPSRRCIGRVPANLYRALPHRCEKKGVIKFGGHLVCRHHNKQAKRGRLQIWNPAIPGGTR